MNKSTDARLQELESRLRPGAAREDIWLTVVDTKTFSGWEIGGAEPVQIMREPGETDDSLRERVQAHLDANRQRGALYFVSMIDPIQHDPQDVRITRGGDPDEH